MRAGFVEGRAVDEALTRAEAEQVIRRLWRMLQPYRRRVYLAIVLLVLQTGTVLAGPALFRVGIDRGLTKGDTHALNVVAVVFSLAAILGTVLGRAVLQTVGRTGELFLRSLRERVFRHLMGLGLDYFETEQTGRLVARMTSDIDALQELVATGLVMFIQNGLLFFGAVVVIFLMSWQLALCVVVLVPIVVVASAWFRRRSNAAYLDVREKIGTNLATLQEGLAGVRVVQAYSQEQTFVERFRQTNSAQYQANMTTVSIATRYFLTVEYVGIMGIALVIGIGGWFTVRNIVTVGTVAAFVLYLSNLFDPIQQLSQLYGTLQSAAAALKKLFDLLDTPTSVPERSGAVDLTDDASIDVADVSFRYGVGPLVLRDVSLHVAAGERVALVGPTGAGKSTLAKLIVRLYDPVAGSVCIGDVDLRNVTLDGLRSNVVLVPQEGFLFVGTVRENVRLGRPDASDHEVDAAIAALGLADRFAALPKGLDTEVAERGSQLSAGERQLVSLARAALADPTVLVLDEATSNLDPGTEVAVEHALETLMEGRTVVVVAHRLSTAARADRVAVIDDGALAELGTHDELLSRGDRYAALFASWTAGQVAGPAA
ncbi:MAG: ABC transporter ATP-binding protein [Acidimicrobiia bacterium]